MNHCKLAGLGLLLVLAGCAGQQATGPATSTGLPFGVNNDELETPNALPEGFTTKDPMAPDTGVVGVTHLPTPVD